MLTCRKQYLCYDAHTMMNISCGVDRVHLPVAEKEEILKWYNEIRGDLDKSYSG